MNGEMYMLRALELAELSAQEKEVPVGAVIVRLSDGKIVGEGRNRREKARSPLAHAEIEAVSRASETLGGWRLSGCAMYVTLEPCPMCAGAVINARLDKLTFGAYDKNSGACGSAADLFSLPGSFAPECEGGFMEERCAELLKNFFGEMRKIKMDKIKLVNALSEDQQRRIAAIACEIWHEYFPGIISAAQTDYMVEKFCSFDAMKEYIKNEHYEYYFIKRGGEDVGYTAIKPDGERLFLSKLYLKKEHRGKKYAKRTIQILTEEAAKRGLSAIWLTVNRHNDSTIAAYKAMGFAVIGEGVTDIGGGYVMDDYFMELKITVPG